MYKCVTVDGDISYRKKMTFKQRQEFVEGFIEMIGNIICNEEGRLTNLSINKLYPQFVGNIIIQEVTKWLLFSHTYQKKTWKKL